MRETGIIRGLDNMGRVVIPKEIRKFLDMTEGEDQFEILMQDDCIVLKKHNPTCVLCGGADDLIEHDGKLVCKTCIEALNKKTQE
ncbi:MAG: AbrB/MazE/SpoVT family DNA-binding domain-containing protein [Clostridia bacterium]|nr:AbrB/MazE/SpoVT family DNA-binding domain-containing protein [Clostridia bacterium]